MSDRPLNMMSASADNGVSSEGKLAAPFTNSINDSVTNNGELFDKVPARYARGFEPQKKRPGCLRYLFNCRCLGMSFLVALILGIVFFVWLITQKPPAIYTPLKEWLNAGLVQPEYAEQMDREEAIQLLEAELEDFEVGENVLIISEQQLFALLNTPDASNALTGAFVDLRPGRVRFFRNAEEGSDIPLWLILELIIAENGTGAVGYIGTERIPLPQFVTQALQSLLLSAFNISGGGSLDLVGLFLPLPDNVQVTSVQVTENDLLIKVDVSTGLEGILR